MARVEFAGWECAAVGGSNHVEPSTLPTGAGATLETTIVRTGRSSGKVAAASGAASYWNFASSAYGRVYVRITARPATTARGLLGTNGTAINIRLNPDGTLAFYNAAALIGTSTTALTDTTKWYRIEWRLANGTSVTVLQIDGVAQVTDSPSAWTMNGQFGANDTVADTYTAYFDDFTGDDAAFPGAGGVALLVPTADSARATLWTAGAGGTTSLFAAVDNLPPEGVAKANETDTSNIEHAGGAAGTSDAYDATMQTYTAAGVPAGATVNVVTAITVTGEDIATGAKLLKHQILSNPVGTATANYDVNGGTSGAHGVYATNWTRNAVSDTAPTVTLGTAPVFRIIRPETASRVACCCFLGILVDFTEAEAAAESPPKQILRLPADMSPIHALGL